jgi:hypothetical protein
MTTARRKLKGTSETKEGGWTGDEDVDALVTQTIKSW